MHWGIEYEIINELQVITWKSSKKKKKNPENPENSQNT